MSTKDTSKDYEIISSMEMLHELEQEKDFDFKVMSNMPSMDKVLDGFVGGELITVSGKTKQGKTLYCQSLTAEFVKQNVFPLWFSYEVMPKYFLQAFPKLPHFYMPRRLKTNTLSWVEEKCKEGFEKFRCRVMFIDHLHYIVDMAQAQNASLAIGTIIRKLKSIAVINNFVIFLLCHTRKIERNEKMGYEVLRDSSLISQESDVVLMISRNIENPESCEAQLLIEFSRRTGALHKVVSMKKIKGYLKEIGEDIAL